MWMQSDANHDAVFAAQSTDTSIGNRPSLTHEQLVQMHKLPCFQVRFQGFSSREWKRHSSLFVAFAVPENNGPAPLSDL